MTETGRFTFGVLCLFLQNYRHASLQKPLAGRPCFLIHHLADQLARKGISIGRLRFFDQIPLTQLSTTEQLLQCVQTHLLIYLSHLAEPFEGKSLAQHRSRHQQCPGRRSEPPKLGANQLTHT